MNIKRRLIISNTLTVIIPFIITVIVAFTFLFITSNILNKNIGYNSFKKLALIQSELVNISGSIPVHRAEIVDEMELQQYLTQRLSNLKGKFIIVKGHNIITAPKDMNKIDIEKCLEAAREKTINKSIEINRVSYIIEAIDLKLNDDISESVVLLVPFEGDKDLFGKFVILILITFIGSFVTTNAFMSYSFTKRILIPIALLKKATSEISNGNLNCEIIEDGDEEIKELCADFELMRIQLKDSINMKMKYDDNRKMLVSSISHDLKTPITSIKGYVEGILDGVANTPQKIDSYLKTIYSKAEHIDGMIDDLLLYSKLDLNQLPFNFEKTDIIDYFNYCVYESQPELEKLNIKIEFNNMLKNTPFVMIDRERMRRVIMNIIDNSRKYMDKSQGLITLSLRETSSSIIIELRDNGSGINSSDTNRIFERFYRGDSSRGAVKGSGLGLAIAKQVIEGHKGRIWAVSHGDDGTSIMISLAKLTESRVVL
jgi:signal transduction histidine kinase